MRDGNLFTGGGVTAGIDMALTVVAEIAGRDLAEAVQLAIEYAPDPPFDWAVRKGRPRRSWRRCAGVSIAIWPERYAAAQRAAALRRASAPSRAAST